MGYRKVMIQGGPEPWSYCIRDAESGQVLPVTRFSLSFDARQDGNVTAEMTLLVGEVDLTIEAECKEEVLRIERALNGSGIEIRRIEAPA